MTSPDPDLEPRRTRIWDAPLRVFHWGLVAAFVAAFVSGSDAGALAMHVRAGLAVGALVTFRLLWGWWGTRHARFDEMLVPPRALLAHLRALRAGTAPVSVGHPPQAAWAAAALLGLLVLLGVTGLLVLGGEEQAGPLANALPVSAGVAMHTVHRVVAWVCVAWVAAHLAGVAKESRRVGENLVRGMVTGWRRGNRGGDVPARPGVAAGLVGVAGLVTALGLDLESRAPAPPSSVVGEAECGSCHLVYDPALLPARAWDRMLDTQHDHFGEDLFLDEATVTAVRAWLTAGAAEAGRTEAAVRVAASVPAAETPARITDLAWWTGIHADLDPGVWTRPEVRSRARCGACHDDAEQGRFEAARARVPAAEKGVSERRLGAR